MSEQWSRQDYLRDVQYRDEKKLFARANLHRKHSTATTHFFPWLASQIAWPHNGHVLDVGCGPGWFWTQGAIDLPDDLHLTLTDLSPGMVQRASTSLAASKWCNSLRALVADAQELPFEDQSFDVVVANFMLYHVPDPYRAVDEIARVLKSDGSLLAATNGPGNLKEIGELVSEVFGTKRFERSVEAFGSLSGRPILSSGFKDVQWRDYHDSILCTDSEDVIAYITSSPPGESADSAQLATLRDRVSQRFIAGDGTMIITKNTGAFVARDPRPVN